MYAIWLLFDQKDQEYISKIINNLCVNYNAPIFTPHITVYGLVDANVKAISKIVLDSIKGIKPFTVKTKAIFFSECFWKTLFIEFNLNADLLKIFKKLEKHLSSYSKYEFIPHTSLIYKQMRQSEKQKLVNELNIKDSFKITALGIQEFSENVEDWRIIKEYYLNQPL